MSFQDTILERLEQVQTEILNAGCKLSRDELWRIFNGETEPRNINPAPKSRVIKKKRKKQEEEPEVEQWRHGKYGRLYLKCVKTGKLYNPTTEELVGIYKFNQDTEVETVTLYAS